MPTRRTILIAAAAVVVAILVVGIGWYALGRSGGSDATPNTATPTTPSLAQPSSRGPSTSASPSESASASPSDRSPSPSGSPALPGVAAVNPDALPRLPFDVVLPATWTCTTDATESTGLSYDCANSSDPKRVTNRLRILWRQCPDNCPIARQNAFSIDWQAAWFGEIRRFVPVDQQTATLETQSASDYFYALSRFTKYDDSPYHYVVTVQGPAADRTLLSAMAARVRTNAG